jgi:DNA helicase-2/ATP-dependent DNA helicase PcrA
MEVAADPAGVERLPARGREGLAEMARIVAELRRDLDQEPAAEILRRAVERTGYLEWLREGHEQEEAAERYDNIMELLAAAAECDRRDPEGRLPAFLERVSLVSDQDGVESGAAVPQFMTLHTAKGLEFDAVAIVGLEDGTLPHTLSQDDEDGLEEERRLFYVGITRARKRLHLSWCGALMTGGEWSEAEGSPFLDELPGACFAAGDAGPEEEEEEEEELDLVEPPAGEGAVAGGARVRHPDYGEGRVLEVRGWSRNRRVKVDFGEAGTKILLLEYADLEVL